MPKHKCTNKDEDAPDALHLSHGKDVDTEINADKNKSDKSALWKEEKGSICLTQELTQKVEEGRGNTSVSTILCEFIKYTFSLIFICWG